MQRRQANQVRSKWLDGFNRLLAVGTPAAAAAMRLGKPSKRSGGWQQKKPRNRN